MPLLFGYLHAINLAHEFTRALLRLSAIVAPVESGVNTVKGIPNPWIPMGVLICSPHLAVFDAVSQRRRRRIRDNAELPAFGHPSCLPLIDLLYADLTHENWPR